MHNKLVTFDFLLSRRTHEHVPFVYRKKVHIVVWKTKIDFGADDEENLIREKLSWWLLHVSDTEESPWRLIKLNSGTANNSNIEASSLSLELKLCSHLKIILLGKKEFDDNLILISIVCSFYAARPHFQHN